MKPHFNNHQDLYQGNQPCFYDTQKIEGLELLERAHQTIRRELEANLADEVRRRICFDKWGLKRQDGWKQIELMIYGVEYPRRIRLFPETMKVLRGIKGVSTIYFSHLASRTLIKGHVGDTDAYYRVHLGLRIPAALPSCGIEVAGQRQSWREGKCLAFNDIYFHSAWNETDEERIVLIVDILRPEFLDRMTYVNSGVRATLYYSRLYEIFFPVIELMPRILTRLGRPVFHWVSYLYHSLRDKYRGRGGHE